MTEPFEHDLEAHVARAWPAREWCDLHVILAVSGGADSVAMLRALARLKSYAGGSGRLSVAHLNHCLRGRDAVDDQVWVERLCEELELPFEVGRADVAASAVNEGDGLEAAARTARYQFLCHTAEKIGARYIAVAHTADDQAETVLHRIVRGTGLAGLAGIPRLRALSPSVTIVRPLLDVRRAEVLIYLDVIGQDFCTDSSNADRNLTRNRLRHELLPIVRTDFNSDVDEALRRLATQAGEAEEIIEALANELASRCVVYDWAAEGSCIRIDCASLAGRPTLIVAEICRLAWKQAGWPLQAMGYDHWRQLAALVNGDPGGSTLNLPGNVQARRQENELVLAVVCVD